jgi:hypothetical protein
VKSKRREENVRRFFVHTEDSVDIYLTEREARAAAIEAIDLIREECDDEWTDEVHSVFWGEVREEARQVRCGENNEFIDYVLKAPAGEV